MEPVISLRNSKKLTRNRTQQICDERQNDVMSELSSEKDLSAKAFRYNFLESLILAQDERWRRA